MELIDPFCIVLNNIKCRQMKSDANVIDTIMVITLLGILYKGVDVVEWSRALDVRLSEWCCSVSMVWVQIPSREEQKFDSSKI